MRRRDALPDPEVLHGLRELDEALAAQPTADPDLALLVADVNAARPEPDAAFLAALDARVHAGFPAEPAASRRDRAAKQPWHARLRLAHLAAPGIGLAAAATLVILIATAGDGGSGNHESSSSSSGDVAAAPPSAARKATAEQLSAAGSADASSTGTSGKGAAITPQPTAPETSASTAEPKIAPSPSAIAPPSSATTQDRKVQRAAELTLTPAPGDVQDTADGVVRETQAAGGYVQHSDISTSDGAGSATFTLRIPSAHLDDTLSRLSELAHVGALDQSASDITSAFVSAADQLSDARAERAALLRALGKATTDRQIASLKARLRDNRSEIAQRKGALNAQRRRADLATVSVTVQGTGNATNKDGGAWTPRDALHDAGRVLEIAGGVALIALAVLAPPAILAALALLAGRTLRRRSREGALDRA